MDNKLYAKLQKTNSKSKKACENCINDFSADFTVHVAAKKINLCQPCWLGFALGMKKAIDGVLRTGNFGEISRKDEVATPTRPTRSTQNP